MRQGRGTRDERRARRRRSQRARRAGRVRIGVGIECVRPLRPWRDARLARGQGRFGDVRLWRSAFGAIAEPEFNVLAELLQLRLEPTLRVLQFLDPAVGLAKFFLEPVDAHHQAGRVVGISRSVRNVGGRRSLVVEEIELRLRRRCKRKAGDERRDQARAKQ